MGYAPSPIVNWTTNSDICCIIKAFIKYVITLNNNITRSSGLGMQQVPSQDNTTKMKCFQTIELPFRLLHVPTVWLIYQLYLPSPLICFEKFVSPPIFFIEISFVLLPPPHQWTRYRNGATECVESISLMPISWPTPPNSSQWGEGFVSSQWGGGFVFMVVVGLLAIYYFVCGFSGMGRGGYVNDMLLWIHL